MTEPVTINWSEEAIRAWRAATGDDVTPAAHNAALGTLSLAADVLANPEPYAARVDGGSVVWSAPAAWPEVARSGSTPLVGWSTTDAQTDSAARFVRDVSPEGSVNAARVRWHLACVSALRQMGEAQTLHAMALRPAGFGPLAGACILAGIGALAFVAYEGATTIRERQAAQLRALELAAQAAAERFARSARTGAPLEPPTPVERAVETEVQQRSESEITRALQSGSGLVWGLAALAAIAAWKGKGR